MPAQHASDLWVSGTAHGQEQMVGADVFVMKPIRFHLRRLNDGVQLRGDVDLPGDLSDNGRLTTEQLVEVPADGVKIDAHCLQNLATDALLAHQHQGNVFHIELVVLVARK